jgi:hypothetical protein
MRNHDSLILSFEAQYVFVRRSYISVSYLLLSSLALQFGFFKKTNSCFYERFISLIIHCCKKSQVSSTKNVIYDDDSISCAESLLVLLRTKRSGFDTHQLLLEPILFSGSRRGSQDPCIVGSGIIDTSIVYELVLRELKGVMIEARNSFAERSIAQVIIDEAKSLSGEAMI